MTTLASVSTKKGAGLVGDLIRKKWVVAVDGEGAPLEVTAHLDRPAGRAWKSNVERWAFTEAIELDYCLADRLLPACLPARRRSRLSVSRS